jgi:hypothetical protein
MVSLPSAAGNRTASTLVTPVISRAFLLAHQIGLPVVPTVHLAWAANAGLAVIAGATAASDMAINIMTSNFFM